MRLRRRIDDSVTQPITGFEPRKATKEESIDGSVSIAAVSLDTHAAGVHGAKRIIRSEFMVLVEPPNARHEPRASARRLHALVQVSRYAAVLNPT